MAETLTQRRRLILEALVDEYISHAVPVPSRVLCEQYGLGVSPATVRSELAGLEERGFVVSPHTSSGRIPTDDGYRVYVDDLVTDASEPEPAILTRVDASRRDEVEDLLAEATSALVEFTGCLAILLGPLFERATFGRLTLMPISSRRTALVLITADGGVVDAQLEADHDVAPAEVAEVETRANLVLAGRTAHGISSMDPTDVFGPRPTSFALECLTEIVAMLRPSASFRFHRRGVSALLRQPEFRDTARVIPMMAVLEDNLELLASLEDALDAEGSVVMIGHENRVSSFRYLSIVARAYRVGQGRGLVAVIGPTRMDYARALSGVDTTSRLLEETL